MQKLYVESALPASPETVWGVFESDAFREKLAEQTGLASTLQEERQEGDIQVRVLKFVSNRELPALAAKALGSKSLTYTQINRFDKANSSLAWSVQIPGLSDRIRVEGITSIADAPGGSKRVVNGDIEVKIRFIGGQIEKVVANQFKESMERAVTLARTMLPAGNS